LIKNKKILIITECFHPEEFRINDLSQSWSEKGFDIDVLTLVPTYPIGKVFSGYKNSLFQKDKYKKINIYRVYAITGYRDSTLKKYLKYINFMILGSVIGILIGRKYDFIFGYNISALTSMLPVVLIKKLYKKKTTLWAQDIWPDSLYAYSFKKTKIFSTFLDIFVKFIYRNTDTIVISSMGFKSKLKPYVHKDQIFHYLPNWADKLDNNSKLKNLGKFKETTHFTFAGNIGKLQNLENIINAYNLLPADYQFRSQLNIIGDGSNLDKLKLIAKNNSNIVFHGRKQSSEMAGYYKSSDFLIISLIDKPIFSAPVPSKTQTYIAAKKPILAIINGDTAEIVKNNNLGLHVNPSSIDDIADTFCKCIDMDKTERKKFIIKNDLLLDTEFNKKKIIESLLNIVTQKNLK
jgi:glycosyltransferase involved in cell wall biosynthesis